MQWIKVDYHIEVVAVSGQQRMLTSVPMKESLSPEHGSELL